MIINKPVSIGLCKLQLRLVPHLAPDEHINLSTIYCATVMWLLPHCCFMQVWSVPHQRFLFTLSGHSNWVRSAQISPDGRLAVTGSDDKTVKVLAGLADTSGMICDHQHHMKELVYSVQYGPAAYPPA